MTLALGLMAGGVFAQQGNQLDLGTVQSPVLVIDFERAFSESAFGRRLNAEVEREGAAIVAENRRIEAELTEEEQRLTQQRASMAPEDFRALADAFDEKVQKLRAEQDAKAEALGKLGDQSRIDFLAAARPVLEALMVESNAAVVLERRGVLVVADAVDITEQAIARIDDVVATRDDGPVQDGQPAPTQP
ncbi:OmpH family outer membrane protein [Sagittula sp. S175]|uniref:OmpH family outer membrane protein n=1 Tax=Sagittula sp. S175 TaxID=3415129 RepID=UPI003C7B57D9